MLLRTRFLLSLIAVVMGCARVMRTAISACSIAVVWQLSSAIRRLDSVILKLGSV